VEGSPAAGLERLSRRQVLEETLLLMLRTKWGVARTTFTELQVPAELVADELASGNLELIEGDRLRASAKGRLIVDGLVLKFLSH
jgi:coproporphyrinogen III oxidase-like Fe-S oxidoreductase